MDHDSFSEQTSGLRHASDASNSEQAIRNLEMPPLEPLTPVTARRAASPSSSPASVDIEMTEDSGEQSSRTTDSESDMDALEVEMQAVTGDDIEDPPLPEIQHVRPPPRSNNRRARVEDDEDDERDRRHPYHRITNPSSRQSTRPVSPRTLNPSLPNVNFDPPAPFTAPPSGQPNHATTPAEAPADGPRRRFSPFLSGGIAISIDLDGMGLPLGPSQVPSNGQADPSQPGEPRVHGQELPRMPEGLGGGPAFAELFSNPAFLNEVLGIEPDIDDPERAERLVNGLEDVPVGLVRRLERVGGMAGSSGGELSGGDSGCAVCWEKLLEEDDSTTEDIKQKGKEEEVVEKAHPKVVSLPCAHVFHAECLRPWFCRPKQTTCPTCRFNIDPDNLTYIPYRQRQRRAQAQASTAGGSSTNTTNAAGAPNAETSPPPSVPSGSATSPSSELSSGEEDRGRSASVDPPRRAGSEPPRNRMPRPGSLSDVMQSFALPGGHLVIVSQPIGIMAGSQGVAGSRQPSQSNGQTQSLQQPAASPVTATPTNPTLFGPPPPPAGTGRGPMPTLGGNLSEGIIAFDIHFPIPPPFFGSGVPQPGQPQPQTNAAQGPPPQGPQAPPHRPIGAFRLPGTVAGVNYGARPPGGETAINATDMLRMFLNNMSQPGQQPSNATQASAHQAPATPAPASSSSSAGEGAGSQTSSAASLPRAPTGSADTTHIPTPSNAGRGAQPISEPNGGDGQRPQAPNDAGFLRLLLSSLHNPNVLLRLLLSAGLMNTPGFGLGRGATPESNVPVKKDWTPPPAPGPTLRQRIERREREAGLRCSDMSCGIGPSDEEPFISLTEPATKQLSIHPIGDTNSNVCGHAFHSACLVSAERVALRGADASIVGNNVEVSCPVCKGVGCVSRADWDDGVFTLQ